MSTQTEDAPPDFSFVEFNPRRKQRGAEAARVEVIYGPGESALLWMNQHDILENIEEFGGHPELQKALAEYLK